MKFLKSDELEVGKCYQLYNRGREPYLIVCKPITNGKFIEIDYWEHSSMIGEKFQSRNYLYVPISTHSFNRIKRYVLAKLDC